MKNKIKKSLGDLKDKVVPASEVPVPDKKEWHTPSDKQMEEMIHFNDVNNELAERLKSFCKQHRTNPDDLFSWLMDNYGKKEGSLKSSKNAQNENKGKERPSMGNWRKDFIKAKTGYSPTD